jgi:hypothetical protein
VPIEGTHPPPAEVPEGNAHKLIERALPTLQREAADLMDQALGGRVAVSAAVNEPENEERGHQSDP